VNGFRDRRRQEPSLFFPLSYFSLELTLGWLLIALTQLSFDVRTWNLIAILAALLYIAYSASKLSRILIRQDRDLFEHNT